MHFYLCVAVFVVGLILYFFTNGKPQNVGLIMFGTGLLATLLKFSGTATLHL